MNCEETYEYLRKIPESRFLLHGTSKRYGPLVPRRPISVTKHHGHRQCGVYATGCVELAILYALFRVPSRNWGWKIAGDKFMISLPRQLELSPGYIHCLPKKPFISLDNDLGMVYFTKSAVPSCSRILVGVEMLNYIDKDPMEFYSV